MSTAATVIVRLAAALLPQHSRDRYREQWLGELRDAPGIGIRASEIAVGSLAFVATVARPLPSRAHPTVEAVARRSRWGVGLALSAAIVAISQYANVATGDGRTGPDPYDSAVLSVSIYLALFSVLAPMLGLGIVLSTRGVTPRVRLGVGVLVLASAVASLREVINSRFVLDSGVPFISPANLVYLAAAALVVLAVWTLWRDLPARPNRPLVARFRSRLASMLGGVAVAAGIVLGWADASSLWAARMPLKFNLELTDSNRVVFEDWLTLKLSFETLVSTLLGSWLIIGLFIACLVALTGFSRLATPRRVAALSLAVFCVAMLSYGAIVGFLALAESSLAPTLPVDVVLLVARWGLVAIILVMVTGVRETRTVPSRRTSRREHTHATVGLRRS